jgi:hypothetical protein
MNKFFSTLISLFFISQFTSSAQSIVANPEGEPYAHPVDFTHLKLDVSFNCSLGQVNGRFFLMLSRCKFLVLW